MSARYGVEGSRVKEGGRDESVWWKNLMCICDGVDLEVGGWFEENVQGEVANDKKKYGSMVRGCVIKR